MRFFKYTLVGVANTALHWIVFLVLYRYVTDNQALCNVIGFLAAASFSYCVNACWTFSATPTLTKYLTFLVIMGTIAALCGVLANRLVAPPWATLTVFSAISLVAGFLVSRRFVFVRGRG